MCVLCAESETWQTLATCKMCWRLVSWYSYGEESPKRKVISMKKYLSVVGVIMGGVGAMAQTNTPAGLTSTLTSGAANGFDAGISIFVGCTALLVVVGFVLKGLRKH